MQEPKLARWLKWLIYASTLVPLVIFAQYLSPFHFGKVIVLRSIVEVMVALYLLLIWRDRSYLPKSHPITWAFLVFTLVFSITSIFSIAPMQSFWGTLERMGGLFTFWHYFLFYIITVSVLRTKDDWRTLLDLMLSVGLISALYGFLQRFNIDFILGSDGRQRIFGTLGNPALFAGYQLLIGLLAATFFFAGDKSQDGYSHKNAGRGLKYAGIGLGICFFIALLSSSLPWLSGLWVVPLGLACYGIYIFFGRGRAFYGLVAALTLLAVAMTAVRGSLVAIVVVAFLATLLYGAFYRSSVAKKILLGGIAALTIFIFLGILFRDTSLVKSSSYLRRITDFSPKTFTVQTRFWAWSAGFKGWSESPRTVLVGWGPENFNVPFSKYFNPKFFTGPGSETFFDRAHNMFVEILVTTGLIGELAYLSLFALIFAALIKFMKQDGRLRMLGIGLICVVVAYMIHNFFIFDTSANFLTFFMILGYITYLSLHGLDAAPGKILPKTRSSGLTGLQMIAAFFIGLLTFICVFTFNFESAKANFASTRAIIAGWQGDFLTAIDKYREAIGYDTAGHYEYRNKLAQYLLDVSDSTDAKKIPDFQDYLLESVDYVKLNTQENPRDYLPYLYITRLYITLGGNDPKSQYFPMALDYTNKALDISPTFVRTYYEVGQAYLNMRDFEKSFAAFSKAAELNPNVGLTYWYMGMVRYQQGLPTKNATYYRQAAQHMETSITKGYSPSANNLIIMISIYSDLGDQSKVVAIHEQLIRNNPDNSSYWASLAVAYYEAGRRTDSITAMKKAIELNPNDVNFVQQAQTFLREIGAQ